MNDKVSKLKKSPLYFYFILFLFPLVFFLSLEFTLRTINYGENIHQWSEFSEKFPEKVILNEKIAKRYFYNLKEFPTPWPDAFDKIKRPNSFRIFVLGESTVAGYPYDLNASFPKEIKRRMDILYPNSNNEVINISMSAISSYVLADLVDGVIEQKPDLLIIYTGHNEYYGALGVGSSENIGYYPALVRFILKYEQLKTLQLIKDVTIHILMFFSSEKPEDGTMMKRMVSEQIIPRNSELFEKGVIQFFSNLSYILKKLNEKNIPVILSNLTSNLKDQPPFISSESDSLSSANEYYKRGLRYLNSDKEQALKYFQEAKDLDMLRFRAPTIINEKIRQLAYIHYCQFVNMDSIFIASSQDSVPGSDLFVDHLHPNLFGYRIMGKHIFETMFKNNLVPYEVPDSNLINIDVRSNSVSPLTQLDSIIAYYKLFRLKNSWPFVNRIDHSTDPLARLDINLKEELYAFNVLNKKITWEEAHYQLAQDYLKLGDYKNFRREFDALIAYAPYNDSPYEFVANKLITAGKTDEALVYLEPLHKLKPSAFSNKWLGIILLLRKDYKESMNYLEASFRLNPNDGQVAYNLSGAYFYNNRKEDAHRMIDECLRISPNFQDALRFRQFLKQNMSR